MLSADRESVLCVCVCVVGVCVCGGWCVCVCVCVWLVCVCVCGGLMCDVRKYMRGYYFMRGVSKWKCIYFGRKGGESRNAGMVFSALTAAACCLSSVY